MAELAPHTYEEIRDAVIEILLGDEKVSFPPNQYAHVVSGVQEIFRRRARAPNNPDAPRLANSDVELTRDVFWDLFRQGVITLGLNDANQNWPFFRLSHFGQQTLRSKSLWRFHDTGSFMTLVKKEIPDISAEAVAYLEEAVASFYADCLLASCVMIGVAAEAEFLRLVDVAAAGSYSGTFKAVAAERFIRQKVTKFQVALTQIAGRLPKDATEDLDTNFAAIQSILRIARNDAGHPTAATPQREQVYVFLQLFVPFAHQVARLRA